MDNQQEAKKKLASYMIKWRKTNPKKYRILKIKQRKKENKNKIKRRAWRNDYRLRKNYCELCGSKDKLEFHHIDYINHSGITVCFNCHRNKIHQKMEGGQKTWQK